LNSNSADLNPIENLWSIWKTGGLMIMNPNSISRLENYAIKSWKNINIDMIKKLIESFPRRIIAYEKANRLLT